MNLPLPSHHHHSSYNPKTKVALRGVFVRLLKTNKLKTKDFRGHVLRSLQAKSGFTLIELIITITIIGIVTIGTYVPYNYYSSLSRVRLSSQIIEQSLSDARILAMNGSLFPGTNINADIGILLKKSSSSIELVAIKWDAIGIKPSADIVNIKKIDLENDVRFSSLPSDTVLVRYDAPNATMRMFDKDEHIIVGTGITLTIGLDEATSGPLSRTIHITPAR